MAGRDISEKIRLRPEGIRSRPVPINPAFDDPDAALRVIRDNSPYKTMLAFMGYDLPDTAQVGIPWFLDRPTDDILLNNPNFIASAREAFGARIVRPFHVNVNINGPAPLGAPHLDQPAFRGFTEAEAPTWMLLCMSYSRLFLPWLVPYAAAVAWFWLGEGGEFEYWPEGPVKPSAVCERPMWNTGVTSDNEAMWHRVGAFGRAGRQQELARDLEVSALALANGGAWDIFQNGQLLTTLAEEETRISLVWKAHVFTDEEHLASFEDERYNLDPEQVTDIFMKDLAHRGIAGRRPSDPFGDDEWRQLLEGIYRPHFD